MTVADLDAAIQQELKREILFHLREGTAGVAALIDLAKVYKSMVDQELKARALDAKERDLALKEEKMRKEETQEATSVHEEGEMDRNRVTKGVTSALPLAPSMTGHPNDDRRTTDLKPHQATQKVVSITAKA